MGKRIDFTRLGGFPLTQDQVDYLQDAWLEYTDALARIGGDGTAPFIIHGCEVTRTPAGGTNYNYSVNDGWLWYGGRIIKVHGGVPGTLDESVSRAYFKITTTATPLTFNDGSAPNVIVDELVSMAAYPIGTADDATKFLWTHLLPFGNVPTYSRVTSFVDGHTITFGRDQTIVYDEWDNAGTGINTLNLDATGAKEGAEVVIEAMVNGAGLVVTLLPITGTLIYLTGAASASFANNHKPATVRIKITAVATGAPIYFVEIFNPA